MGFGANLFFSFSWPIFLIIGIVVIYKKRNDLHFWKSLLVYGGGGLLGLVVLVSIFKFLNSPMIVDEDDLYGEYIIDRSLLPGTEADWQYNHCRIRITEDEKVYLDITEGERHIQTYTGTVEMVKDGKSTALKIKMNDYNHIIPRLGDSKTYSPSIYRSPFHFTMVVQSPWYYNMYFKKGKWKPL